MRAPYWLVHPYSVIAERQVVWTFSPRFLSSTCSMASWSSQPRKHAVASLDMEYKSDGVWQSGTHLQGKSSLTQYCEQAKGEDCSSHTYTQ
mmetsp:Transcript_119223/g.186069  ORF Transcript_119223/g.186069 Transcript_119223/m.186069 type:complete len:91 (+) Transcript_119223:2032-2304(+)